MHFIGEDVDGYGGPRREFLNLLMREVTCRYFNVTDAGPQVVPMPEAKKYAILGMVMGEFIYG